MRRSAARSHTHASAAESDSENLAEIIAAGRVGADPRRKR